MKQIITVAVALLLTGCGTSPKDIAEQQRKAEGEQALQQCLVATEIATMRSSCFRHIINDAGPEASAQADKHWSETVAKMSPDKRLLAAVLWPNIAAAKEAITSGANVNREFTSRVVTGPTSTKPEAKHTVLGIAVRDFEPLMAEFLMQHGADPNWREDGNESDMFTGRLTWSQSYTGRDGNSHSISGFDMAKLALKYGFVPTAHGLVKLETLMRAHDRHPTSIPNVKPLYEELVQRTTPNVKREYAALKEAKRREEQQRASEEQRRNAERLMIEERSLRAAEQATRMLNERKRIIGTKICKEAPGRYGTVIYVGYVEGLGPEKLQIRVSNAVFKNAPSLSPGGFRENIMWDYPANWDICE